jgi:hypothetical protein
MYPIKSLLKRIFCWHKYKQLVWHGLLGEPDLMECKKCGKVSYYKDYLIGE